MKSKLIIWVFIGLLILGGVWWLQARESSDQSNQERQNIIARNGVHWHPELEIYVNGQKQEIPQNVGLGTVHQPLHTHEDLPIVHMEFSGSVTREDTQLGNFFRVWGKDFMEFGSSVIMTVNGVENMELGNYQMKDGDKIELRYEK